MTTNDEAVWVELRGVRMERLREFGVPWMALGLWRLLELDVLLESLLPAGREEIPWSTVAAILTAARFCRRRLTIARTNSAIASRKPATK